MHSVILARKFSDDSLDELDSGNGTPSSNPSSESSLISRMSLPQIWKFVEEAHVKSVSLIQLAKVKKTDKTAGAQERCMSVWQSKMLALYKSRAELAFRFLNHFCVVTDSSCHGCKDTLISLFYSPVLNNCAFATCQFMKPGKVIQPFEMDLDEHIEYLAARREVTRLHAYRFMQAVSHQVSQMTSGKFCLSSFKPPRGICLKPLSPGDSFEHITSSTGNHLQVKRGGALETQDTACFDDGTPVLTLVMDQGSGMAAMAYLQSLDVLVHCSFDKVHRCIRDLKLASQHASGNFGQTTLMTSFVWSLNYKPFKSGAWFEEKKCALNSFLASETSVPELGSWYNFWHVMGGCWFLCLASLVYCCCILSLESLAQGFGHLQEVHAQDHSRPWFSRGCQC